MDQTPTTETILGSDEEDDDCQIIKVITGVAGQPDRNGTLTNEGVEMVFHKGDKVLGRTTKTHLFWRLFLTLLCTVQTGRRGTTADQRVSILVP